MTDSEFDRALVAAAFLLAGERGWTRVSIAEAARRADLGLDRARARFPGRAALLHRFGSLADQAALAEPPAEAPARDRLFELLMRRVDFLQSHRAGMLALLRYLPTDPCTSMMLACASLRSMGWLLEGAAIDATGPRGALRAKGLLAVWLATVNAWRTDQGEDLAATMAALDRGLRRAEQVEGWMAGRRPAAEPPPSAAPPPPPADEATFGEDPFRPD
jgi:AcrR family transcriptional regulator